MQSGRALSEIPPSRTRHLISNVEVRESSVAGELDVRSAFLVYGANTGIGLATAHELIRCRATVIIACRDLTKGERAARSILDFMPDGRRRWPNRISPSWPASGPSQTRSPVPTDGSTC